MNCGFLECGARPPLPHSLEMTAKSTPGHLTPYSLNDWKVHYNSRSTSLHHASALVKGCRMSAPTRRTNECSSPFRADVGQPLQGGNRVGYRRTQISAQAMGI